MFVVCPIGQSDYYNFANQVPKISMRTLQILAFITLTSTSLIVIICYWLLAFFKFYFSFQQHDNLLTDLSQNCPVTPEKYYSIVRFSMTQWITIIIASLCIIIEVSIFMMICIISKNKNVMYQSSDLEVDESKKKESDEATHSYIINQSNRFKAVQSDEPTKLKKLPKKINKLDYFIIAIAILFMSVGTNIGHTIQGIISLNSLYKCIKQKQAIKGLLENYITLAALLGYNFISAAIRMIVVGIIINLQQVYQRKPEHHKRSNSIAIQTQLKRQKGEDQSLENIENDDMEQEDKDNISVDSKDLNGSMVDNSGVFHMPKLNLGSYYENSRI